MPTYYLYRHIRHDKNEPFYIGVGKKRCERYSNSKHGLYQRAYDAYDRNVIWKSIVSKTEYTVEILFESSSKELISKKEIEFISVYGRIGYGGLLANMNCGGYGCDTLQEHSRMKLRRPVFVYRHNGHFHGAYHSRVAAAQMLGVSTGNVATSIAYGSVFNGFVFFNEHKGARIPPRNYIKHGGKTVLAIDVVTKNIVCEYPSMSEWRKIFKKGQATAYNILNNGLSIKGIKYCFKDNFVQ
jgi:hypothetical protein